MTNNTVPSCKHLDTVGSPMHTWEVGCGGAEIPMRTRTGVRVLYMWLPCYTEGDAHAYLNLDTDIFMSYDEAKAHGL